MQPSDIGRIVTISDPAVSPDGATVAYVVTRTDLEANRYRSAVWLAAADGSSAPYQFSAGEHNDSGPMWSPDGRRLAFTSRRAGDEAAGRRATLHIAPVTVAGEVVQLAERAEGFGELGWSPDGSRLAFTSRVPVTGPTEDAAGVDGHDRATADRARPPRRIDRLFTRIDDEGWIVDRPQHVFVVAVDGDGPPRQVTTGPYEDSTPTWSPDGSKLALLSARHDDWDLGQRNDVYVVDVDEPDAEPRQVTAGDRAYWTLSWSPDSDRLALISEHPVVSPSNARLSVLDASSGTVTELATDLDRTFAPFPGVRPPIWDGDDLLVSMEDGGRVHLVRVPADGSGATSVVVGGDRCVSGFHAAAGTLACIVTTPTELPEVYVITAADPDGVERCLSHHGAAFASACPPLHPERFTVACPDGYGDIDAWIILPAGVDPSDTTTSLPMLLEVHGGPHTQYGERWFDEFQLLASAGYVVVYANPRGSSGREETWGRSIRSPMATEHPGSGWGGVDVDDLLAVVDAALDRAPCVDPDRLGVLGGSYGGYMTSWLIGHSRRFKAACSERAVNNLLTLESASDAAGYFRFVFGVGHLDEPEHYLERSPITYVRDITTPVLILHSENDLRCPIEQADQLFVALRLLGKEFEYHRFPAESHELSRSGSPKHRVQRAELILDWFERKLVAAEP